MPDSNEKKVIVLSPAGSKVKASDITKVTADVQGDISDPMKSRDTETGSLKKVDATFEPGKAKMTIKLKPLKPKEAPQEENPKEAPTPMDAFKTSQTASPTDLQGKKQEDETVKIDKKPRTIKPSEAAPTSIPGAKQTIKLRPSTASSSGTEGDGPRPSSPMTMKLRPVNVAQDQSTPSESASGYVPEPGFEDEQTVAMQKRTIKLTPTRPSAEPPQAAPTVKLTADTEDEQTVAMQKRTIKLTSTRPSAEAPQAAPTVKLTADTSVKPPSPSIPTLKLVSTGAQPPIQPPPTEAPSEEGVVPSQEPLQQQASAPKRTLKLRTTHSAPAVQPVTTGDMSKTGQQIAAPQGDAAQELSSETQDKGADEPNIIFTIAASVTFLALAYFAWMAIGQFGEEYLGWQTANVPGLSGKVQ